MKKVIAFVMAITIVFSMAIVASADGTTTLTTNVPLATYTLNIPANQEITYGTTNKNIGQVRITDSVNFAKGKNVHVTVTYTEFISSDVSTTIPFTLVCPYGPQDYYTKTLSSGSVMKFLGNGALKVEEYATITTQGDDYHLDNLHITMNSTDWGKALGGDYTATITFTSQVVVEE